MGKLTDIALCVALEGNGEELDNISVYCVQRRGHLLLALPADREAALVTLKLYQPQVFMGKVVAVVVGLMVRVGLHRLLPSKSLKVHIGGPLAVLVNDLSRAGFLLGNPDAESRRALVVHHQADGYVVDKVGVDKKSRQSVIAELEVIKMLPDMLTGTPDLYGNQLEDTWASYTTGFVEGSSPSKDDDELVIGILGDWMKNARCVSLCETGQWQEMADSVSGHEVGEIWTRLEKASSLSVKVGVFHGDFAPWNIKLSNDGGVTVLDWETGCNEGPTGWDWLHYMIQRAILVDEISVNEALDSCHTWAETEKGKQFLDSAGWGRNVELWIGSYLAYSSWIAGFDRKELLTAWMGE